MICFYIDPANGVQLKIWQCYDNLPGQQWYYRADNRIALENQGMIYPNVAAIQIWLTTSHNSGFCMDLENGTTTGSKAHVQTWTCSRDNHNQIWTL